MHGGSKSVLLGVPLRGRATVRRSTSPLVLVLVLLATSVSGILGGPLVERVSAANGSGCGSQNVHLAPGTYDGEYSAKIEGTRDIGKLTATFSGGLHLVVDAAGVINVSGALDFTLDQHIVAGGQPIDVHTQANGGLETEDRSGSALSSGKGFAGKADGKMTAQWRASGLSNSLGVDQRTLALMFEPDQIDCISASGGMVVTDTALGQVADAVAGSGYNVGGIASRWAVTADADTVASVKAKTADIERQVAALTGTAQDIGTGSEAIRLSIEQKPKGEQPCLLAAFVDAVVARLKLRIAELSKEMDQIAVAVSGGTGNLYVDYARTHVLVKEWLSADGFTHLLCANGADSPGLKAAQLYGRFAKAFFKVCDWRNGFAAARLAGALVRSDSGWDPTIGAKAARCAADKAFKHLKDDAAADPQTRHADAQDAMAEDRASQELGGESSGATAYCGANPSLC
jgi:hypothetical protein